MAALTIISTTYHYTRITKTIQTQYLYMHNKQFNYRIWWFDIFYMFLKRVCTTILTVRFHKYSKIWESIWFWRIPPRFSYVGEIANETLCCSCAHRLLDRQNTWSGLQLIRFGLTKYREWLTVTWFANTGYFIAVIVWAQRSIAFINIILVLRRHVMNCTHFPP